MAITDFQLSLSDNHLMQFGQSLLTLVALKFRPEL
jgi:hypothetical protein